MNNEKAVLTHCLQFSVCLGVFHMFVCLYSHEARVSLCCWTVEREPLVSSADTTGTTSMTLCPRSPRSSSHTCMLTITQ